METLLERAVDRLDTDLSRRRRELSDLWIISSRVSGQQQASMCRVAHVAAYAHWEGFSKAAIETYLNYLCETRKTTGSLCYELRALRFRPLIDAVARDHTPSNLIKLIRTIETCEGDVFDVRAKDVLRVGNMVASSLKLILDTVGLEYLDFYAMREKFIDEVLCGRRHRIAHGGLEPIDVASLREVIDGVTDLCSTLNEQIQTSLVYGRYAAAPARSVQ